MVIERKEVEQENIIVVMHWISVMVRNLDVRLLGE